MPDDALLGEFQEAFAGAIGTIEEYPQEGSKLLENCYAASQVIGHKEMWEKLMAGPENRVDSRAFLRARFLDFLIGDWDRHRRQWRWVKIHDKENWQPNPEDRDQVFVSYEGLLLSLVRRFNPHLVTFKDSFPKMEGLTWNGRSVDRWILTGLDRSAFVTIAKDVKSRVTDDLIEEALQFMPKEYYKLSGAELSQKLKIRREKLIEAAEDFYDHLVGEVDIHCTDKDEIAAIHHRDDGKLDVRIFLMTKNQKENAPYFHRVFLPDETKEIRIYLYGGNDRTESLGHKISKIKVRVIGGEGSDTVDDSNGGGTLFYDSSGNNRVLKGPGTKKDERSYIRPIVLPNTPWVPPREWGRRTIPLLWPGYSSDFGLLIGGSIWSQGYGFRKYPNADNHTIRAGFTTGAKSFKLEYEGKFRRINSTLYSSLTASFSGIEILNYYGFGNETPSDMPADFYKVKQNQFHLFPALHWKLSSIWEFFIGPELKYANTKLEDSTFVGQNRPYGSEEFGQVGLKFKLVYDTSDPTLAKSPGIYIHAGGFYYPKLWSVDYNFGGFDGIAVAHVSFSNSLIMALRVGGKKVFGTYPFHEAAFIGGQTTVKGLKKERFGGDASLFGNVELRLTLGKAILLVPGDYGILGLADVGRVFLTGESSKKWHPSYGGGFFFTIMDLSTAFSFVVVKSDEWTSVYFKTGFSF